MPRIIAYTYDAGMHCIDCFNRNRTLKLDIPDNAENIFALRLLDREGNEAHPVFSTDETECTHCDTCHSPLT